MNIETQERTHHPIERDAVASKFTRVNGVRLHYLDFIPPSLESVEYCLRELSEFQELTQIFPLQFSLDEARRRVKGMIDASAQDHAASR